MQNRQFRKLIKGSADSAPLRAAPMKMYFVSLGKLGLFVAVSLIAIFLKKPVA